MAIERRGRHPLAQPPGGLERLAVEVERLAQPERPARLLGRLEQIVERPLPVLGEREVVGEHLVVLGKPVGVQLLDGEADQAVQLLAPLDEERGVGHVLGQRVLEHVGQLGVEAALVDQLERRELAQQRPRSAPGSPRGGRRGVG